MQAPAPVHGLGPIIQYPDNWLISCDAEGRTHGIVGGITSETSRRILRTVPGPWASPGRGQLPSFHFNTQVRFSWGSKYSNP